MVVFTRKYPLQRLLKKRTFKLNRLPRLKYGTAGLYCLHTFRFEYKYCLFLRKTFKSMFRRRRRKIATYCRRKSWMFIRPNYTLTRKSKNARMGKGKGNFKRWCTIVYPGRIFIEHLNVSPRVYLRYLRKVNIKLKVHLKSIHVVKNFIKDGVINSGVVTYSDNFTPVRLRKSLFN